MLFFFLADLLVMVQLDVAITRFSYVYCVVVMVQLDVACSYYHFQENY